MNEIWYEGEYISGEYKPDTNYYFITSIRSPENDQEAKEKSVEKWTAIVQFHTEHPEVDGQLNGSTFPDTCGFCNLYHHLDWLEPIASACEDCPIKKKTSIPYCQLTPFDDYYEDGLTSADYLDYSEQELQFVLDVEVTDE